MSAPYREMFIETAPVRPGSGHCPWCRAAVDFNANERIAICPACDATFATSIARWTEPPPENRTRRVSEPPAEDAAPVDIAAEPPPPGGTPDSSDETQPDDGPARNLDEPLPMYGPYTRGTALIAFLATELILAVLWLVAVTR